MGHGGLGNLVCSSKFPQLFEKDSGRRAGQGPQKKGEGRVRAPGSLLLDSKFPGAGGVDRSLGPGTTGRGGGWSGKFSFQF